MVNGAAMKFAWQFNKVNPRFKNREATQGEFFSNDTELRGFVREAVQNSLDARRPRVKSPVRVRIFISGEQAALQPDAAERYFGSGWDHFRSEGSGLRDVPNANEPCQFVVYEDSGTTGLTGDVTQYHEVAGVKNPFYYFFRAEGQSNKTDGGRGRWGLGKFVFPRSSRIRSFFGVTVRHDDKKRLLVGQSILRSHNVKGKSFTPDGWFGVRPDRNEASLPVSDQRFINKFLRDFQLKRGDDPGLSIVVPFCDHRWTMSAMRDAVVQDYFYPILRGDLIVTLETPGSKLVLNADSIPETVESCGVAIRESLRPLVQLAQWSLEKETQASVIELPVTSGQTGFSAKELPSDVMDSLRSHIATNSRVAIRVPMHVTTASGQVVGSGFDVYLERCDGSTQKRPLFIRDGIVISEVRTRPIRDVHMIVSITDPALSALLGDAENPAHTEWSEESSHFKGKYQNGNQTIRKVRNSPAELCQMILEADADDDPVLLLNVFSLSTSDSGKGLPVEFAAMSSDGPSFRLQRLQSLKSSPRTGKPFRTTSRKGGFRVGSRSKAREVAPAIEVAVAYDRRSGSPLKNFRETDFNLRSEAIQLSVKNAIVQHLDANRIRIVPQKSEFEVIVTGFDVNRDLFLKTNLTAPAEHRTFRAA